MLLGPSIAQMRIKREPVELHSSYVLIEGDTILGQVRYAKRLFGGVLNLIEFTDAEEKKHRYRASDIDGFSISGQDYCSMEYEGYHYFFRPAIQGRYSLYYLERHYHRRNSAHTKARKAQDEGKELRVFVARGNQLTRLYRVGFREQLKKLTASEGIDSELFADPKFELARIEDFFYTYLSD